MTVDEVSGRGLEGDNVARPVVIIGGVFSSPSSYRAMQQELARLSGRPVRIADIRRLDWRASFHADHWERLLAAVDDAVGRALDGSPDARVTLVGHSSGGLLARLYLDAHAFADHLADGVGRTDCLITLGTHHRREVMIDRHPMYRWLEEHRPGAYHHTVRYVAVAGRLVRGDRQGTPGQRLAHAFYRGILRQGAVWGDGLVPVDAALLEGAHPLVLDGVAHFGGLRVPWYGSPEIVRRWWSQAIGALERA